MATIFVVPWRWTREQRQGPALVFASRFDGARIRSGWRLFTGGLRLRRAVLSAPGALGVSLMAHPIRGRYYTLSMWRDEESLLAFAHGGSHRRAVQKIAAVGPVQGILLSRSADPTRRPRWRETKRWVAGAVPGPYRHQETDVRA